MPQLSGARIGQAGIEVPGGHLSGERPSGILESLRPTSATRVMKPRVSKPRVSKPRVTKPKVPKPKVPKPKVPKPKVPKPGVTKAGQRRRESLPIVIVRGLAVTSYRLSLMGALAFLVVVSSALVALNRVRPGH